MNSSPLHFALRELRLSFTNPRALGVMLMAAIVLGVTGPFGTFQQLATAARFGYWSVITVATYGVGFFFAMLVLCRARDVIASLPLLIALLALAASVPVTLTVTAINMLFLGDALPTPAILATLWVYCFIITLGVSVMVVLTDSGPRGRPADATAPTAVAVEAPAPPAILRRLPLPQRGTLRYLSMQDHYVDVVTDKGHALILMRLSDAIAETAPLAGLQVHRSHWIALDAVRSVSRGDGKAMVEMVDGVRLPVSRSYLPAARQAGLLT